MTQSWPEDWDRRKAGEGCPLCASLGQGDNKLHVVVAELEYTEVRLERRSLLPGYCMVIWRHGHVSEPTELDPEALRGFGSEVVAVAKAIDARFQPIKMNYLTLGNWVPHLHTHVVPRYLDDPAPGGPITWSDMFGAEPVDPGLLALQAEDLRRILLG